MQKHQTKCTVSWIGMFLQPFQMNAEGKKTEVSGVVYSFEFIPMAFFAISHVFFRNRRTSAFAINYVFLSQLNYTLSIFVKVVAVWWSRGGGHHAKVEWPPGQILPSPVTTSRTIWVCWNRCQPGAEIGATAELVARAAETAKAKAKAAEKDLFKLG